jgi:hypothetical protein
MAMLVRLIRYCPRGSSDDDIILQALALSPLLMSARRSQSKWMSHDRIRAAVTIELLSSGKSASRLWNEASKFNRLPMQSLNDNKNDADLRVFVSATLKSWNVKGGWQMVLSGGRENEAMEQVAAKTGQLRNVSIDAKTGQPRKVGLRKYKSNPAPDHHHP